MKRNSGLGQPGPRTYEQKGWQAEILKPMYLAFGFGCLLTLLWIGITLAVWLDDPHSEWLAGYKDNPGAWLKVVVIEWMIAGVYLFLKWTETFWDDDYTTLTGDHPMLGILPMRPLVRIFLFIRWLRSKSKPRKSQNIDVIYRAHFGDDGDEQ